MEQKGLMVNASFFYFFFFFMDHGVVPKIKWRFHAADCDKLEEGTSKCTWVEVQELERETRW